MANRISVLKTYKIYIGGNFPRTESGRYYTPEIKGKSLGNICLSSGKDFRNAVVAAEKSLGPWAARPAFNRSQILYRIAEMLESGRDKFAAELKQMGFTAKDAEREIDLSVDRVIYYAGWCDKFQQIFSSVNPVSSAHFNFSNYEPSGVIAIVAPEKSPLLGFISAVIPVIAGGNTCVVLASQGLPLCAVSFAEILNSSDVPGGVVNILTGKGDELIPHMASHMAVHGLYVCREINLVDIENQASENMKRVVYNLADNWTSETWNNPYAITDHMELKTTWHPIETIGGASSGY